jgi:hypothetical protein
MFLRRGRDCLDLKIATLYCKAAGGIFIEKNVFEKQAKYFLMNILSGGKILMKIEALET